MKRRLLLLAVLCGLTMTMGAPVVYAEDQTIQSVGSGQIQSEDHYVGKYAALVDQSYAAAKKNTVISPLSIDLSLAMLEEGAAGQTKQELNQYLGADYRKQAPALIKNFKKRQNTTITTANSAWCDKSIRLKDAYANKLKKRYQGKIAAVDFTKASTIQKINTWTEKKTNHLIKNALKEGDLSEETKLLLVNTLYFKGQWSREWTKEDGTFTDGKGKKSDTTLLNHGASVYYENEYATGFRVPYNGNVSFVGILPKSKGDFTLSDLDLDSFLAGRKTRVKVDCYMPKLNFHCKTEDIKSFLQEQGVSEAFTDDARFTKVSQQPLKIDAIIQKCKIKLDEKGTEAAAATMTSMALATAYPGLEQERYTVRMDRPYAFLIQDDKSGQILFMGKVTEAQKK